MEFIRFFKWWWIRNGEFERTIGCFLLFWGLPCLIAVIWFGKLALIALLLGIIVTILGWVLYSVFMWFRDTWRTYKDENPPEDIQIIRKLKGIPTPSRLPRENVYYD